MGQAYNRIGIIGGEKGDTMTAISMLKDDRTEAGFSQGIL